MTTLESTAAAAPQRHAKGVGKQVVLPLSKAAEISFNSIRLRLGRSLLVTSAIVLALAFFVSIQANETILDGMRAWIRNFDATAEARTLQDQRGRLSAERDRLAAEVRANPPREGTANVASVFGADYDTLRQELGRLPVAQGVLERIAADADATATFERWIVQARDLNAVQEQLARPARLQSTLEDRGVPTTPEKIAANRTQTRWLLGLALLVAFVGILNAMLMSVTERFREIGTMKCLGALDGFIIKLFLLESLFQGFVGTLLGVLLGLGLSLALAGLSYGGYAYENLPWTSLLILGGVSLVVGVALTVAGALMPAYQAARMQPIEAMRSDV